MGAGHGPPRELGPPPAARRSPRRAVLGIGDSHFNSAELVEVGFAAVATAPVLLDLPCDAVVPDRPLDGRRWLFVGRIVPNKAQHDLVAALAWYRAVHDPAATLRLVGGDASAAYRTALEQDSSPTCSSGDAVTFTGRVEDDALRREYERATHLRLPLGPRGLRDPTPRGDGARRARGRPRRGRRPGDRRRRRAGPAGKAPALVAAAVHRLATDPQLTAHLVARRAGRARRFDQVATGEGFLRALGSRAPAAGRPTPTPRSREADE